MRNQFFRVAILGSALCAGSVAFAQVKSPPPQGNVAKLNCSIANANHIPWTQEEVFGSKFPLFTKVATCPKGKIATGGGFRYEGVQHYTNSSTEWHVVVNEPNETAEDKIANGWRCGVVSTIEREVVVAAPLWCTVICCNVENLSTN